MKHRLAWLAPIFALALLVFGVVLTYFGIAASQHDAAVVAQQASAIASNAQREINGNHSMMEAVCDAFRVRELAEARKWHALTNIERKYNRVDKGNDAYHAARRKAMTAADKAGALNYHFDCVRGLENAYIRGAHSNAPQKATH